MAVLMFGGGHYVRVHGSVDDVIGLLSRSETASGGWARVQSGTELVRVNARQVAYVAEDSAVADGSITPVGEPYV